MLRVADIHAIHQMTAMETQMLYIAIQIDEGHAVSSRCIPTISSSRAETSDVSQCFPMMDVNVQAALCLDGVLSTTGHQHIELAKQKHTS